MTYSRNALAISLLASFVGVSSLSLAQNHNLIIGNGATFSGNGTITIKDSIRSTHTSVALHITGKIVLSGSDQAIVTNAANGSLQFDTLSIRGSGVKTIIGTVAVAESLNVLSGTTLSVNNDTLRIGNIVANAGTVASNTNTVIEYTCSSGAAQSILGGTFQGKVRLTGNTRKNILGTLTVDSLEHSGWGLAVNNNLNVNGKAEIDSLIDVVGGMTLSLGANNSTIATLQGNDGIIQANSTGTLTFTNNATNGSGTIRTDNSTITFNGDINSSGTLAVTGTGTMIFGGVVSSTNYSFTNGSTEIYNGGAQTIPVASYGYLTLSNAGTKKFSAGTTGIGGTIALNNGAAADAITNSTTIDYNGTGAQTIAALDYHNLNIADHGIQQITLSSANVIRVNSTFTNSINNTNIVNTDNTFEYNGSSAQTITKFPYFNLTLSGGGAKTISDDQIANGDVVQQAGTALAVNTGVTWQIDGSLTTQTNFVNDGDITIGN
jgi:hypothetical protein